MIRVVLADITTLKFDAIVNAANETLLGGGGVDGAIHHAAGPQLKAFCRTLGSCPTGEARISPGFNLPAKWVIHTTGPVWRGGTFHEPAFLANCYHNTLDLALQHGVKTIAFPAISTGVYAYPKEQAAAIAVAIMREHEKQFDEIICCCYSAADRKLYEKIVQPEGDSHE